MFADNLCKQSGPRSRLTDCWSELDPNCLTLIMFLKEIFSSPEPKALVELIGWDSSLRPSVHPCVHTFSMKNYPACKEVNQIMMVIMR